MNKKVICEKCGTEMIPIDPHKPFGMKCPECGWGWATTYIEPIQEDTTDYTIVLLADPVSSNASVKTIADIAGVGLIQAKKMMENAPQKLFVGKAESVKKVMSALEISEIQYRVEPIFPYIRPEKDGGAS